LLAIGFGLVIFCMTKGTPLHRCFGYLYVASMFGLNGTALLIYRVFGTFGPFHVLAIISLVSVVAGVVPAYFKRPPGKWLRWHYVCICWSYVGLLAATASEIAVRLPLVRGVGLAFGLATFAASFIVIFIGAFVLYRYRDQVLADFGPSRGGLNESLRPTNPVVSVSAKLNAVDGGPDSGALSIPQADSP
jgi:uncharacterized membrane protein